MSNITYDELLAEYEKFGMITASEEAYSVRELSSKWKISERKTRDILNYFKSKNRLVIHRVHQVRLDGRVMPTIRYSIRQDLRDKKFIDLTSKLKTAKRQTRKKPASNR